MKKLIIIFCMAMISNVYSLVAQTKYNFALQFTFEGTKEGIKTQFSVFYETKSATWLLTNDDTFGGNAPGLNYWILKPNGDITMIGDNEFEGPPVIFTEKNYGLKKIPLKLNAKKAGTAVRYGKNNYGWTTYLSTPYSLQIGRMNQKSYLVKTNYNFAPLYAYNSCLNIENYLPAFSKFNYAEVIPKNYLVTEDAEVKLISVSPTEYYLEVPK